MFNIRDLFRQALLFCDDITETLFPNLFANKRNENRSGNVSIITHQEFRKLMIFIARIIQAHLINKKIGDASKVVPWVLKNHFKLSKITLVNYLPARKYHQTKKQ